MEQTFTIKNWSEDDKPREKLMLKGSTSLSDAELVAILIGSGSRDESALSLSKRILASVDNKLNTLDKLSIKQLMKFKGIGEAKAISIAAALELGKRRKSEEKSIPKVISSSRDVFEIMQPIIGELPHEEFWVVYLNNSHTFSNSEAILLIFKMALEQGAVSIILTHNHPSGKLQASEADKQITTKLKIAGDQLDIKVLDHIIITELGYFSFQDEGIF